MEPVVQTVPVSLGKVMVLLAVVGSVKARVVVISLSVAPSKTSGEPPRIWALESVMLPVVVKPVAATIAPKELTWNRSPLPTVRREAGEVSPMPTLPRKAVVVILLLPRTAVLEPRPVAL